MPRAKASRNDYTQSKLLGEITTATEAIREMRRNLHKAREGHLHPDTLEPEKYSVEQIEAARTQQTFIDATEAEVARLEGELAKAWSFYGGLEDSPGRVSVPAQDLEAEIAALVERRRALDRRAGTFAEDFHTQVDQTVEFHRERLDALAATWPPAVGEMVEMSKMWTWRDESFVAFLHSLVDQHEFPPGSRDAWREQQASLARQISKRQAELELRSQERELAAAEAAKTAAEAKLAAVGST